MDLKKWVRRRVVAVQERFQRDCLKAQERAQKAAQKKKQQEKRKTKVMRKKIRLALGGTGVVGEINPAEYPCRQGRPVINTPRRKTIRRKESGSLYRPLILTSEDIRREAASERARRRKEREREEDFIHPKIQ